jgi:phage terminase large subunit GpA-like protein
MTAIELRKSLAPLADPPPALNVWQWAELRRYLGRDVTAKPGKYSADFAPYQRAPQESFTDPNVQVTVLYWGKRLGKTEMINNLHGSVIEQDPRNMLHCMPTLDSSKKHRKQFFNPMVRNTPALRPLIRDSRSRDADNTLLSVKFPGGTFSMIGANSPSGFRQVQAPVVSVDEIDAMEATAEGDPVYLSLGRAENYPDSVQVVSSTATFLETSRIHAWYEKSDKQMWHVKAPCCGNFHVMAWGNVKWPKDKPEEAFYECPDCGKHWDDTLRLQAIRAGQWRATAPFKGIRGYWLNGLNSVFAAKKGFKSKLHQFAGEFLDAYEAGEAARLYWKNTFLCEAEEIKADSVEKQPLLDRREEYGPDSLPDQILIIVAAVDVQGDRLEYEIIGQGEAEETWGIEYGRLPGNPERPEVWQSLAGVLSRKFHRRDGIELNLACCTIDHRHKGGHVRKFIRTCGLPRVWAVYGAASKQSLLVVPHFSRHYGMQLYSVNGDLAKDTIFARLKIPDHGPRFMHFPTGNGYEVENRYFDGLTAEEARVKYSHGFPVRYYWKDPSRRNEPLDLRVYALAAIDILKPRMDAIKANLEARRPKQAAKIAELPPAPPPEVQHQPPDYLRQFPRFPGRPSGGFVNRWRK